MPNKNNYLFSGERILKIGVRFDNVPAIKCGGLGLLFETKCINMDRINKDRQKK